MKNVHIIVGEDDYLVQQAAKKIVGDGTGLELVDSSTSGNADAQLRDIQAALSSYFVPPFLDPRKVTWWKNVGFLPGAKGSKKGGDGGDREDKTSEEVKGELLKFAETLSNGELPENQHFIITASGLLQQSVFAKTLLAAGAEFISYEKPKDEQRAARFALERTMDFADSMGLFFAPDVEKKFAEKVGLDTRTIVHELEKLRDWIGSEMRPITSEDIEAVTSQGPGVETTPWQVTDPISARNAEAALAAAAKMEGQNGYPIMMSTILEKHFRTLAELKDAAERGKLRGSYFGMPPRSQELALKHLAKWTMLELRTARVHFMKLRERCVSANADMTAAVAIEIVRACAR